MLDASSSFDPLIPSAASGALGSRAGTLSRGVADGEHQRKLGDLVTMLRGMSAQNIQAYSPDGTRLMRMRVLATRNGGGGDAGAAHPFRVQQRVRPGTTSQYEYMVGDGILLSSYVPDSDVAITGLNEWIPISATRDHIWLNIPITNYTATAGATIETGSAFDLDAEPWTDRAYIEAQTNSDPLSPQTKLRVLIATITPPETTGSAPTLTQRLYTNLIVPSPFPVAVIGRPAALAVPSPY